MGSLFSPPKPVAVAVPQPVYIDEPAPAPATADSTSDSSDATTTSSAATPAPPTASQSGLLERSRGLLSTVLTGFDGILTNATVPQGKSLLGE